MSSVTRIEIAIQKLSVAEQRIIALHLGERLVEEEYPMGCAADEGIRFLPQYDSFPEPRESRGQRTRQHAKPTR